MNLETDKKRKKCLFLMAEKGKRIKDCLKPLKAIYNGTGWFIEEKYHTEAHQISQQANMRLVDWPLNGETFDQLRSRHKREFFQEQTSKLGLLIYGIKTTLQIKDVDNSVLLKEQRADLEQTPLGKQLLDHLEEHDHFQEQLKRFDEEEKISNITINGFGALLKPISEEEVSQELKATSCGITTGIKIGDIDLKIPGGAVSILAGPTSHGKTAVLINIALGTLKQPEQQELSVHFFSYEESRAAIISLFLNTYIGEDLSANNRSSIKDYFRNGDMRYFTSDINKNKIYPRQVFPDKKNQFFNTLISTKRLCVHYSEYTVIELVEAIRFLKTNSNIGLICIDYMQLLKLGSGSFTSRQEELKQACLLLKNCAIETGLPILIAAQFNRQVVCEADLSPTNIGEAGDIERVANMIIGFWNRNFEGYSREGNKDKSGKKITKEQTIYMEILKGRETGAGHSSILQFDGNSGKISNQQLHPTARWSR